MMMCLKRALAVSLVALYLGEDTLAGPKDAEVEAAVDLAVADWAPTLTCHVLEPEGFKIILDLWNSDREKAVSLLISAKTDEAVVKRIIEKTEPENVMIKTNGSAKELIAFCKSHPDWLAIWTRFENAMLSIRVKRALNPQ
jgi:hypothetical protein